MAQVDFRQYAENANTNSHWTDNGSSGVQVQYFSLKNDGDEAVVRIMHDSIDDFDSASIHDVDIGNGRTRKVSCLRNPKDPTDVCPLCRRGAPVRSKIYLHLIQYVKDENGRIIAQPKVWERPISYGFTIANYINEYGKLSNSVFKIKRNGAAGSNSTKYDIILANPTVYTTEAYPIYREFFDKWKALGNVVLDKSFDEIEESFAKGEYRVAVDRFAPTASQNNNVVPRDTQPAPQTGNIYRAYNNAPQQAVSQPTPPPQPPVQPTNETPTQSNNGFERPRRFYK